MIDYVNTEIVSYANDLELSFNLCYPSTLPLFFNTNYNTAYYNGYLAYEMRMTNSYISSDSPFVIAYGAETRIYAFLIRQVGSSIVTEKDALSSVGVCYYVLTKYNINHSPEWYEGDGTYLRLSVSEIPIDINNPFNGGGFTAVTGNDVFWLYNFGSLLVSNASSFSEILNFNINGYSFLSFMFVSGFVIYMGWSIIKWVIPL